LCIKSGSSSMWRQWSDAFSAHSGEQNPWWRVS
jgi:hypothetical protein